MLIHIVKPGESLWSLLTSYGLFPVEKAIQKVHNFNALWFTQFLFPGQHLLIPLSGLHYKVKLGDTLWFISKRFNFPINELISYNNITHPTKIYPGLIIRFPDQTSLLPNPEQYTICVDPGHQAVPNLDTEPNAPGSDIKKFKVDYGTRGVYTGKPEYELNLEVSMKIKELLSSKGYNVLTTRETNNVNISNIERSLMANNAKANLCVKIHAYSSNSSNTENGLFVMYPSPKNPYNMANNSKSFKLAELILANTLASTQANSKGLVPKTDLTGFNWSNIPVVLVEMGYMTNPQEDIKLSTPEYQYKIAVGIVNGIEKYLALQIL